MGRPELKQQRVFWSLTLKTPGSVKTWPKGTSTLTPHRKGGRAEQVAWLKWAHSFSLRPLSVILEPEDHPKERGKAYWNSLS